MNYRMIKHTLSWILFFEAIFLLVPTLTALIYKESALISFLFTIAVCLGLGLLFRLGKPKNRSLYAKEGFVIVSLGWIILSFCGALPFYFSGEIPSFVDALFESVSGFTTTGSSILADVEALSRSLLMWRSFTHWVGGMGVLVFIMAFLPLSGGQNMHMMRAESPGPSVGKLVPRIRQTALLLYAIYFVLTMTQVILLLCGGMSLFEALNTAFATAGTGGFGVKGDSLAGYSPFLQVTVTVFMLLFSLNFGSYYLILRGKFKDAFQAEIRVFLAIVAGSVLIITLNILQTADSFGTALNESAFTVASIISTTGFATADFNTWPALSKTILVLLMFIGACAGSTGGGIKVSRIMILFKGVKRELRQILHPNQVKLITVDDRPIEHAVVNSVSAYLSCYVILFAVSLLLVSLDNFSFTTGFTAVAATFNNIGPGLELVGPTGNFSSFSVLSKLVLMFDMLAGRLEIFPMLLLFTPATWKKI